VPEPTVVYRPFEKLVLTDGVSNTLFRQYEEHRQGSRGEEETGWMLMGVREEAKAIALATLPAGMEREAGVAHVRFNSDAQAVASRILRQEHRQLGILGVVHTHPGSLRHPSNGDYHGDKKWVGLLRGGEGAFGIGTADGEWEGSHPLVASQPKPHVQCYRGLRFSWYALGVGDRKYRSLPVEYTIGPDLAQPLHSVWPTLEAHAERLDRLCRRLKRVAFTVAPEERQALHVIIPLDGEESIRVLLHGTKVEYCLIRKEQWLASDSTEPLVDRGVFGMLAALAAEPGEHNG
jgi:proteasome lid subunit RPN8/RPN11